MSDPIALAFIEQHPAAAAQSLVRLHPKILADFIVDLPARLAAMLFQHMAASAAGACVQHLPVSKAAEIVAKMPAAAAATLLRTTKRDVQRSIMQALPTSASLHLRLSVRYPEGLVGAATDPKVFTLLLDFTVNQAIKQLRRSADSVPPVLFVLDDSRRLKGMVEPAQLLMADAHVRIKSLTQPVPIVLNARAGIHTVRYHPSWEQLAMLPVVNYAGVFQGVLWRHTVRGEGGEEADELSDEFGVTQQALADLFWMGSAAIFSSGAVATPTKRNQP
jgi:Mg/Co/Ni transporter MgtE